MYGLYHEMKGSRSKPLSETTDYSPSLSYFCTYAHTHTHIRTNEAKDGFSRRSAILPKEAPRQELRTRMWCSVVWYDEGAQDETDTCSQSSSGPEPRKLIGSGAVTRRNTHTSGCMHRIYESVGQNAVYPRLGNEKRKCRRRRRRKKVRNSKSRDFFT